MPADTDGDGQPARPTAEMPRRMMASERLARRIAAELVSEETAEGTLLPPEREMAERYGVGRSTVREALRLLETWGAVRVKAGRNGGPIAQRPSARKLGEHLSILMEFERVSLADLFDARRELDVLVAGLSAVHMSDEGLIELGQAVSGLAESIDDGPTFFGYNDLFQEVLAAGCANTALRVVQQTLKAVTGQLLLQLDYPREWREICLPLRRRLFRAIASRDADLARKEMLEYRDAVTDYWSARWPDVFSRPINVVEPVSSPQTTEAR